MNRGAGRRHVFSSDDDRQLFLTILEQSFASAAVDLHAFCLMGNHYHLLLQSMDGRLSQAMKHLSGKFTQALNYRDRTDGALFRGRYASILIASDAHLLQAVRYIHLNPVDAGLVVNRLDWRWSSAPAYEGGQSKTGVLKTQCILDMFGSSPLNRHDYIDFLNDGVDAVTQDFYVETWGQTHGSDPMLLKAKLGI